MQRYYSYFITLFFISLYFYTTPVQAQRGRNKPQPQEIGTPYTDSTIVYGVLKDAKTKDPIPFADVYFMGTSVGTITDFDGNYRLATDRYVDSIGFRFLGYKTKSLPVKVGEQQELNTQLKNERHTTQTTVVTAKKGKLPKDTIAIRLWRNVVKHRKDNLVEFADSYQYDDYTKIRFDLARVGPKTIKNKFLNKHLGMVMRNIKTNQLDEPFLPLMLKETVSSVYHKKKPKKNKQIIHADRFSGVEDSDISDFVGDENEELNPFDNIIVLLGKSFVGPFAPGALGSYRYYIADTIKEGDNHYYKLEFVGRRPRDFVFIGHAIIDSTTFGVTHIEMEVPQITNIKFLKKYHLTQDFEYVDDRWVQTQGYNYAEMHFPERPGVLFRTGVHRHTYRYNYEIDHEIPDTIFKGEKFFFEDDAFSRDSSYWTNARVDTLNELEKPIYPMIDSVINSRLVKNLEWWGYFLGTGYLRFNKIELGSTGQLISNNNIEGLRLRLGFRTNKRFSRRIRLTGYGAYGFKDQAWKYGFSTSIHLNKPKRRWRNLSLVYKKDFEMVGQYSRFTSHDNLSGSFSRNAPINRLMDVRDIGLYYTHDWTNGFYNILSYRRKTFFSVPNVFEFSTGEDLVPLESFATSEFKLTTHWGIGEQFFSNNAGFGRRTRGTKHPIFELNYSLGLKDFWDGSYNYHKLDFSMRQRLSTILGFTRYTLSAGKFWGDASYPLLFIHTGNQSEFLNRSAFNMMNEFEFVSDAYASIMFEHHFDGIILNKVPLIRDMGWRTVFIFNGLYGTMTERNRTLINMPLSIQAPGWYGEMGFGIEGIFDALRVDFLWRLTPHLTPSPYLPPRRFAIKLGIGAGF